jgi:hypothetical protein
MVWVQFSHTNRFLPPIFTSEPERTGITMLHMKHFCSRLSIANLLSCHVEDFT